MEAITGFRRWPADHHLPVIGTAGWSIPAAERSDLDVGGSTLERYARRFVGVEINSSFYRPHRPATWARWAASVPSEFRFSVKIPKEITHARRLVDSAAPLQSFLDGATELGAKLGVLLLQLPPSLTFEAARISDFVATVRTKTQVMMVCEPRHASWFEEESDQLLFELGIPRVAADPPLSSMTIGPGGFTALEYWRLHGSPIIYRSNYSPAQLATYGARIKAARAAHRQTWCIFDNTAASAAFRNALDLQQLTTD